MAFPFRERLFSSELGLFPGLRDLIIEENMVFEVVPAKNPHSGGHIVILRQSCDLLCRYAFIHGLSVVLPHLPVGKRFVRFCLV